MRRKPSKIYPKMADNYLENKFDELKNRKHVTIRRSGVSLDTLLKKNRSFRGFDKDVVVTMEQLREIVSVNQFTASARNRQALRFRLVVKSDDSAAVLKNLRFGGALPELHLPFKGTEPEAFIIVMSTVPEDRMIDIDMGISLQSMGLKAVEMGLNVLIVGSIDRKGLQEALHLPMAPLMVLAVGKGTEKIFLKPIKESEDHDYYRSEGIHYVPKLTLDDLIV
jgi:nitroreductase